MNGDRGERKSLDSPPPLIAGTGRTSPFSSPVPAPLRRGPRLDRREDVDDLSIRPDQECAADDPDHLLAVHVFSFRTSNFLATSFLSSASKVYGRSYFSLNFNWPWACRVRCRARPAGLLQLFVSVAEAAGFDGATRSIGPGIEEQDHVLARNWSSETGLPFSSGRVKLGAFELISISHYLYRKFGQQAMTALLAVAPLGFGMSSAAQVLQDHTRRQQPPPTDQNHGPAKNAKRGPRAIAVVEFLPGGGTRLVPIAIWIDDRFYDASLLCRQSGTDGGAAPNRLPSHGLRRANGIVYRRNPKEVNGSWVADGRWTPHLAMDEKLAQQAAKQPKQKAPSNSDDDRPVLHRAGSNSSSGSGNSGATSGSSSNTPPPSDNDPDRPTLKNSSPSTATTSSAPASSAPTPTGNAPKTTEATQTSSSPASSNDTNENDPSRPLLRRGKPAKEADQSEPAQASIAKSPAANERRK